MTWSEAMRIASVNVGFATDSANAAGGGEDTDLYVRVAETAISYAREVREATDGKATRTIEEMMQG